MGKMMRTGVESLKVYRYRHNIVKVAYHIVRSISCTDYLMRLDRMKSTRTPQQKQILYGKPKMQHRHSRQLYADTQLVNL